MEPEWIPIDSNLFLRPRTESLGGVETEVVNSPFDLPVALKAELKDETLILRFRYLTDEPVDWVLRSENVTLKMGKDSGRLFAVEVRTGVPSGKLKEEIQAALSLAVHAIGHAAEGPPPRHHFVRRENLRLARATIQDRGIQASFFRGLQPLAV